MYRSIQYEYTLGVGARQTRVFASSSTSIFIKARARFVAWKDDIRPQFRSDDANFLDQTAIFSSKLVRDAGPDVTATIDNLDNLPVDAVSSLKELAAPWFSDQILPFRHHARRHERNGRRDLHAHLRRGNPERRFGRVD